VTETHSVLKGIVQPMMTSELAAYEKCFLRFS